MLYAVKDNRTYQVGDSEALQKAYLAQGFDIVDETGKIITHSPTKTVPFAQYAAVLAENEQLKAQLGDAPKGRK